MERKGVTQYALIQAGIDRRTLDWLKKNRNITMLTLEKLCRLLECSPNDIVRFIDQARSSEKVSGPDVGWGHDHVGEEGRDFLKISVYFRETTLGGHS